MPLMRMMGAFDHICYKHCGWMVPVIGLATCMTIYAAKLLYCTSQHILSIDAFGDSSFLFLAYRYCKIGYTIGECRLIGTIFLAAYCKKAE
jgi:hypothetical protein